MQRLHDYIDYKQQQFAQHAFFHQLHQQKTAAEILRFAPYVSFWVMVFQDVLRLNVSKVQEPALQKIARHHQIEDRNHHLWFLEDMALMNQSHELSLSNVFDQQFTSTRDSAYAIVSEVFSNHPDILRIVLLLTLESTGHVFFGAMAAAIARTPETSQLRYFSDYHLQVEKAHELFEAQLEAELMTHILSEVDCTAGKALVDRVYTAFYQLFDGLLPIYSLTGKNPTESDFQNVSA